MFQQGGNIRGTFLKESFVLTESEPQCFVESCGEAILEKKKMEEMRAV